MTHFGVEEEFFFLNRSTLAPVSLGSSARESVAGENLPGAVSAEFLTCQIEHATSPVSSIAEARAQLDSFRGHLTRFAKESALLGAGMGTPFGTATSTVVDSARYRTIARWLGDIVGEHQVNGLHVHVEIPDADDRVRALNALRPWLPVLLSLSTNSPFWRGHDTGFGSWRTILLRRLPTIGSPPPFRDADDYRACVNRLIELGAAPDAASLAWLARVSERFPTVEVRVFDAQLTAEDALLLAALTRALLTSAITPRTHMETDAIDTSLWMAAREGLDARLLDPMTGGVSDARSVVQLMLRMLAPALQATNDLDFVTDRLARLLTDGTGADRQRRAFARDGITGLRALLERSSEARLPDSVGA